MPSFLPTGSLTGVAFLAAVAWLIRFLRRSSREDMNADDGNDAEFGTLSPQALVQLVVAHALNSVNSLCRFRRRPCRITYWTSGRPNTLSDVPHQRPSDAPMLDSCTSQARTCFNHCTRSVCLASDIRKVFSRRSSGDYHSRFPTLRFPRKEDLIICVSEEIRDCRRAVQEMESLGYDCSVYLKGGFDSMTGRSMSGGGLNRLTAAKHISRHAVALMLGLTEIPSPVDATVIDVRRVDELVIFGSLRGTEHLVVNELPKALTLDPAAFKDRYQFAKPGLDDVVVTTCRTNKRAIWAAQLLIEAGYTKVFVHHTGSFGWRFSSSVKPYDSYFLGNEIPQPKSFTKDVPDASAGLRELEDLGLIGGAKNDSARSSIHLNTETIQDATHLDDSAIVYFTQSSPMDRSSD